MLEANYTDRDAKFTQRLMDLESLRMAHILDEHDDRVAALEATTTEFASWLPGVDGVLDDVRIAVQQLERSRAR